MRCLRWLGTAIGAHTHRRLLSTSGSGIEIVNASRKVDEEHLPHYKPVNVFESRYQVLSKLGYGSCSTVWLSRDIMFVIYHSYITEVNVSTQRAEVRGTESLYLQLSKYEREHAEYAHLRKVLATWTDLVLRMVPNPNLNSNNKLNVKQR